VCVLDIVLGGDFELTVTSFTCISFNVCDSTCPNKMLVPVCLTCLTVPDKVALITTIKKPGALGSGYLVSCDYLPSALSRSQSPADTGPPPLNFIVDYLGERGEEQCCCIKLIGSDRSEEEASDIM